MTDTTNVAPMFRERADAEAAAQTYSRENRIVVTVYKRPDGWYQPETGYETERGGSAVARFHGGHQEF